MILGEYDNKFKNMDPVGWVIFVLMTVLTTVIMLRMLVVVFLKALDGFDQSKSRNRVRSLSYMNSEVFDVLSHTLVPFDTQRNKLLFAVTEYACKETQVHKDEPAKKEENVPEKVPEKP